MLSTQIYCLLQIGHIDSGLYPATCSVCTGVKQPDSEAAYHIRLVLRVRMREAITQFLICHFGLHSDKFKFVLCFKNSVEMNNLR